MGLLPGSGFPLNTRRAAEARRRREERRRPQQRSTAAGAVAARYHEIEGDSVRRPGGEPPQPSRDAHVCSSVGLRILWCGVPERRAALVLRIVGGRGSPAPPGERVSRPPGVVARSRDRPRTRLPARRSRDRGVLALLSQGATIQRWRSASHGFLPLPLWDSRGPSWGERSRTRLPQRSRPARRPPSSGAASSSRRSDPWRTGSTFTASPTRYGAAGIPKRRRRSGRRLPVVSTTGRTRRPVDPT
jgi:hypothetical protein